MADAIGWYDANAETLSEPYETVPPERIHHWLRSLLPRKPATILDVGAGSGRDAAWLAAEGYDAFVEHERPSDDQLGRPHVQWTQLAIRLPDDGTGALPLLRHVILNDDKSSTYKLGLLRALCRIADGAAGLAWPTDDDHVSIPMGLVALTWIRL